MFVLLEVNLDGSFDNAALVFASESRSEVEQMMDKRWHEVRNDTWFEWCDWGKDDEPFSEYDKPFCILDPEFGYASLGVDGNGEMLCWYIFDTNDRNTTC